jgi:beta-glucosidase
MERYQDTSLSPAVRARDLLAQLSLKEKIAQLVGYNPASWSDDNLERDYPLGAGQVSFLAGVDATTLREAAEFQRNLQKKLMEMSPHHIPAIFHIEALCGVMLPGTTSFPSGIAQGATFDPVQQKKIGRLMGRQGRLAGGAQAFAPVLDISRDPRFGRQGETYGEDPALASAMGTALVQGLQQDGDLPGGVLATAKHFLGYHDAQGGIHAANCDIPERLLREVYAKPFQAAITEGNLGGIMPCYSALNGQPVAGSADILTKLLRQEMGFAGLTVSDYCAVQEAHTRQHVCESLEETGRRALLAGMDQELPSQKCYTALAFRDAENEPELLAALDRAVEHVLTAKFALGLFENPCAAAEQEIAACCCAPGNAALTRESARESLVLLKNKGGLLPLRHEAKKVAVIGYHADSLRAMFGGYTYLSMTESALGAKNTMAGVADAPQKQAAAECYPGTVVEKEHPDAEKLAKKLLPGAHTLLEELREYAPEMAFSYAYGYPCAGSDCTRYERALEVAREADLLLITVGGKYGTGSTASMGEGIDGTDINLPVCQERFLQKAAALGKPIVLLHFGGRPLSSDAADACADAILECWNPAEQGAPAIVQTLFGAYDPAGRMPVTTPFNAGQIPVYYNHSNGSSWHQGTQSAFSQYMDCPHRPRYYFGYGLSYTEFKYKNLCLKQEKLQPQQALECSVEVQNTGVRDGEEVVQLYVRDCYASTVRPVQELVAFARTALKAGESKRLDFTVRLSQLALLDADLRWKVEAGKFDLMVGASSQDIRLESHFTVVQSAFVDGRTRGFCGTVREKTICG